MRARGTIVNINSLKVSEPALIESLRFKYGVLIPQPLDDLVVSLKEGNVTFEYRQRVDVLEKVRGASSLEWDEDVYLDARIKIHSEPQTVIGAYFVVGEKVATIQFFEDLEAANDYVTTLREAEEAKASAIEKWRRDVKASRLRIQQLRAEIDELNQRRLDALGGGPSDWIMFGKLEEDVEMKTRQLREHEKIASSPRPMGLDKSHMVALEYSTGTVLNLSDLVRLVSKKYWEVIDEFKGMLPQRTEIHILGPVYALVEWRRL